MASTFSSPPLQNGGRRQLHLLTTHLLLLLLLQIEPYFGLAGLDRPELPTVDVAPVTRPEQNAWYRAVALAARLVTNESCYVCAQLPNGVGTALPVAPWPLKISETMGVMVAFTKPVESPERIITNLAPWLEDLNISVVSYEGSAVRFRNVTTALSEVHHSIMTTNPTRQRGAVCFVRECRTSLDHNLGTSFCNQTVKATCGSAWNSAYTKPECRGVSPYLGRLNLTHTHSLGREGEDNPVVTMPSSDGFGALRQHVWVCGQHVYQSLRPGWCGSCYLARLLPSVAIVPSLEYFHTHYSHYYRPHRTRRTATRVSQPEKGLSGILPWWGTVNNAHKIDEISLELENLTELTAAGFAALSPVVQGIRNVALQNRVALDLTLASQGGVCHVIGTKCCTFVPAIDDNMTHVVAHLNELLHREKSKDSEAFEGWDIWSWLTEGGWKATAIRFLSPVLMVVVVMLLVVCCVLPCCRALVGSAVSSAVGQYPKITIVPDEDLWVPPFLDSDIESI